MAVSSEARPTPLTDFADSSKATEELIKRLNESLKHYNDVSLYAPVENLSQEVQAQRAELSSKLDSIRGMLAQVATAIERTTHDVQEAASLDATRVLSMSPSIHWYEHGNLLDLTEEHMMSLLKSHPPKDAVHFGACVHQWLSTDLEAVSQAAEAARDAAFADGAVYGWKVQDDSTFLTKRLSLIFALLSLEGGVVPAYHELVWAKVNFTRVHYTLPTTLVQVEQLGNGIDRAIGRILSYEPGDTLRRRDPNGRVYGVTDICTLPLRIWGETMVRIKRDSAEYLDTVGVRRMFYRAWRMRDCGNHQKNHITDSRRREVGPCWHAHNAGLMEQLTWRSHEELEHNAMVAAGSALPRELVDEITDYLIILESLPLDPNIRDTETGEYNWEYDLDDCDYDDWIR
ncbi:hypothetical protein LTR27_000496 [Elasticomyces elasticus]|nr:hypothetical protein LTR27_000496 [Elasticomyces elasticus]